MSTYAGPATVVLEDGTHVFVNVNLCSSVFRGRPAWRGAVGAGDGQVVWYMSNVRHARLRMPDGREGVILPEQTEALGGRVFHVTGSGPAPF